MPHQPDIDAFRASIDDGDLAAVKVMATRDPDLLSVILRPGRNRDYRALTEAAVAAQLDVLAFCIESGCSVAEDDNYPMFRAALYDRCIPAMALLVAHGADVDGVWDDYGPPLIAACEGRAAGSLAWLLDQGAKINGAGPGSTREVAWNTVIHATHSHRDCPQLLQTVLERGGDPNSGLPDGRTALHAAARHGDVKAVRLLLDYGADPNLRDLAGLSALDVTRNQRLAKILEPLIDVR